MKNSNQIIGVIGAMQEEITPLLEHYKKYETIEYANNQFYKIINNNTTLFIVQSKIGKVFATITTTILIERFKCNKILFTGVAGGIDENLKVGDILIGNQLCQHDFDITDFGHPHGHIPGAEIYIDADKNLLEIAKKIAKDKKINLKTGIIATGDQFISSIDRKKWINKTFSANAIEMEGGAVAQTCKILNIPFFILRSISDSLEGNQIDFNEFVKKTAKKSASFMVNFINKLIEIEIKKNIIEKGKNK